LLFQALDEKEKCVGIYASGEITKDLPVDPTHTWKYASFLGDMPIEYASIYCNGQSLEKVCPLELQEEYDRIWSKLKAFYKSFSIAKVSLDDHCFFDLVPEGFLKDFCDIKDKITQHVFKEYERPENYGVLQSIVQLTTNIKQQKLNIDLSVLNNDLTDTRTKDFYKKIMKASPYIKYNPFGTKTGRLTTEKHSFPILTMDKKFRKIIKPNNEWFVELDFNAAELRVMLGLQGVEQPYIDIHDHNAYEIFGGKMTREDAKKRIFSWLYNPNATDEQLSKVYDRDKIKELFWDGKSVKTMFNREIPSDEYHALNYIIQSTCSDLIMGRAASINKMLQGKKTKIAFIIHDSIVLDYADEDGTFINTVYQEFMTTPIGRFRANVSGGRNFGDMKSLWIY
tara:strand:+ start:3132 stop:4319 length:1188 start_codon:yes stop_codon:yes gene_type:complete